MNKLERFATIGIVTLTMIAGYMPNVLAEENEEPGKVVAEEKDAMPGEEATPTATAIDVGDEKPGENTGAPATATDAKITPEDTAFDEDHASIGVDEEGNEKYILVQAIGSPEPRVAKYTGKNGEHFIIRDDQQNVTYEYVFNEETDRFELNVIIPDELEGKITSGDQTIDLNGQAFVISYANIFYQMYGDSYSLDDYLESAISKAKKDVAVLPGEDFEFAVNIISENGHTYQYKDGSFQIGTGYAYNKDLKIEEDGKLVAPAYANEAIVDLLNKANKKTKNIKEQDVIDALKAAGYEGETALSNYYLKYFNDKLGEGKKDYVAYTSFVELAKEHPEEMVKLTGIKDYKKFSDTLGNDSKLAEAFYNYLFNDIFQFAIDDQYSAITNPSTGEGYTNFHDFLVSSSYELGIGEFADTTSAAYIYANNYFKALQQFGKSVEEAGKLTFEIYLGMNGPHTNNTFKNTRFGVSSIELTLEQVDSTVVIDQHTDKDEAVDSSYNLYYLNVSDDGEVAMYYSFDEDGNVTYTTDKEKAAVVVIVDGRATVNYLLPKTYYLKELLAPDGISLKEDAVAFAIESGIITEVEIVRTKPDPDPEPDPDPDPNPVIIIPVNPPVRIIEEPVIEEEVIPEGPAVVEEVEETEIIEDESTALADTGTVSTSFFYGLGSMLVALGATIRRRFKK